MKELFNSSSRDRNSDRGDPENDKDRLPRLCLLHKLAMTNCITVLT